MKRQSNIRRLCHQALAATLITGSLMGTGLLGNKVVYGNVGEDVNTLRQTLSNSGASLKDALHKIKDTNTPIGLLMIISSDADISVPGVQALSGPLATLVSNFNKNDLNKENRNAVLIEIQYRLKLLKQATTENGELKYNLEKEKLEKQTLNRELVKSREAHRTVSEISNELEKKLKRAIVDKKQAEEQAKKATAAKEKAEKDTKTAQQESEQAKKLLTKLKLTKGRLKTKLKMLN